MFYLSEYPREKQRFFINRNVIKIALYFCTYNLKKALYFRHFWRAWKEKNSHILLVEIVSFMYNQDRSVCTKWIKTKMCKKIIKEETEC